MSFLEMISGDAVEHACVALGMIKLPKLSSGERKLVAEVWA